jgi:hypothetical protein
LRVSFALTPRCLFLRQSQPDNPKNVIQHRHIAMIRYHFRVVMPHMAQPTNQRCDFGAGQLVLIGAATIVLLVFAWTYVG